MSELNATLNYGWTCAQPTHTIAYIEPVLLPLLKQLKVRRVLDLGAGNGALCGRLAAAGFETVGVEFDAAGVQIARTAHPQLRFHRYGVQDDPARLLADEAPFDAVISTEVIEHLYSPQQLVSFARAVLVPQGRLVVTTPYHGYLKNLALSLAGKWDKHHTALWHGGHIKFWSRKTLTQLFEDNGFAVQHFAGLGRLPWLWKSMLLVGQPRPR